jgi:hypothetical protein
VDLNRLYFRHQILQMRAQHSPRPEQRTRDARRAAAVAARIGSIQRALGAPAGGSPAA